MTARKSTLGLGQATLALSQHDPKWAYFFEIEASLIAAELVGVRYQIDHIGSTAVPGLAAKPILDIAMRSTQQTQVASGLKKLGYIDRGIRSGRLFIKLYDGDVRTHNLHLYQPDDRECKEQIAFRDALRADPKLCDQYAELKQDLVDRLGDAGRSQYANGKTGFVNSVLSQLQ
ncbi:MAG: GrpB family protein [Roseobacter sp.]